MADHKLTRLKNTLPVASSSSSGIVSNVTNVTNVYNSRNSSSSTYTSGLDASGLNKSNFTELSLTQLSGGDQTDDDDYKKQLQTTTTSSSLDMTKSTYLPPTSNRESKTVTPKSSATGSSDKNSRLNAEEDASQRIGTTFESQHAINDLSRGLGSEYKRSTCLRRRHYSPNTFHRVEYARVTQQHNHHQLS